MDSRHPSSEDPPSTHSPASDRLDSWKSISAFLRRDVRTVQRWEANEGLPVYRNRASRHGPIHAYKSEIEAWWRARGATLRQRQPKVDKPRTFGRGWPTVSYVQLAVLAATLILVLVFSLFRAKQMFLSRKAAPSTAVLAHPPTLAVLPFQSSSNTTEDRNVALNITEELIGNCRRSKTVRVIDQSLVMPFENSNDTPQRIAQLLHSDKLLRGTAGRSGKSVRVTAQLIDTTTGNAIWSKQFESNDEDLLESERQIANQITAEIEISLASQPQAGAETEPAVDIVLREGTYSVCVTIFSDRGRSGSNPLTSANCAANSCPGTMYGIAL